MLKYFLPSISRGIYRLNPQLCNYIKDDNEIGFVKAKQNLLPTKYLDGIKKLIKISKNEFNNEAEASIIKNSLPKLKPQSNITRVANQFLQNSPYLSIQNDNNYLEREFIRLILARVFNLTTLLENIVPQYTVSRYRLDFAVFGEYKYAIEIDGFGKFKQRADLDDFLRRQNYIVEDGWRIYRFSYADIIENTEATLKTIINIFSKDAELSNSICMAADGTEINLFNTQILSGDILLSDIIDKVYAIQDLFIHNIEYSETTPITISENLGFSFPLTALSLSYLYEWYDAIFKIFDIGCCLPDIIIKHRKNDSFNDLLHPKIELNNRNRKADFVIDELAIEQAIGRKIYPFTEDHQFVFRREKINNAVQDVRTKLGYFAESIFGYENIRYEQDEILKKILSGSDVIGLLPTGSGKSFCFWLPAIIKPGLTIVISPLKALMRDQDISLKGFGIFSTAFINSDVEEKQRQAIYNDIKLGLVRLLYISPERMQIKDFLQELDEIMEFVPINFLVIDESHCVSEWGHDFRPSYLRIPQFADKLRLKNPNMTLIALTATAGEIVKRDMMRILGFDNEENIISAKNFNRPNLSMQFITVDNYFEKSEKYDELFYQYLPTVLHKDIIDEIFEYEEDKYQEKGVGLVFCIYADSHGKYSIYDSVAHYLRQTQYIIEGNNKIDITDFSTGSIRGFSSKSPTLCPNCFSSQYITIPKNKGKDDSDDNGYLPDDSDDLGMSMQ